MYDVNLDGKVELQDAIYIYNNLDGISGCSNVSKYDLNGDCLIGSDDIAAVLRHISGLE